MKKNIIIVVGLCVLLMYACSSDEEMPITGGNDCMSSVSFKNDIQPILNKACTLSGCHEAGFSSGDYTNYSGVKAKADNGRLNSRVVVLQNMPPSNSGGPKDLSSAEIELFRCWIEAGAPNN